MNIRVNNNPNTDVKSWDRVGSNVQTLAKIEGFPVEEKVYCLGERNHQGNDPTLPRLGVSKLNSLMNLECLLCC